MKRPLTDGAVKEIKGPKWGKAYPDSPFFLLLYFRTYYTSQTTIHVFAKKNIIPSVRSHKKTSFKPEATSESRFDTNHHMQSIVDSTAASLCPWHLEAAAMACYFLARTFLHDSTFWAYSRTSKKGTESSYLLPEKIRRPPAVCRRRDFFMHQSTSPIEQSSVCYNKCMSLCTYALTLFFYFLQEGKQTY